MKKAKRRVVNKGKRRVKVNGTKASHVVNMGERRVVKGEK